MIEHDDARMLALVMIGNADAQALPEYPVVGRLESGYAGKALVPYRIADGCVTVGGHSFDIIELLACVGRLREMARLPVQGRLL